MRFCKKRKMCILFPNAAAEATKTRAKKSLTLKILMHELGVQLYLPKVLRDSGATIEPGEPYDLNAFGCYIQLARQLFHLAAPASHLELDCGHVVSWIRAIFVGDKPKPRLTVTSAQIALSPTGCAGHRGALAGQHGWGTGEDNMQILNCSYIDKEWANNY
jgi:hypothetical protein